MTQPSHADIHRDLGELDGRMKGFERELVEVKTAQASMGQDLKAIRSTLDQAKGGWKTLFLVAGAAGAVGALLMKLASVAGFIPLK